MKDPNYLDLVNGIFTLFSDNVNCINTWGFYLFGREFDDEPELRNRAGVIWLTSLLDSLEGEQRSVAKYKAGAANAGYHHLVDACDQATRFFRHVAGVLTLFTKSEQLFINDLRDQWVHSWLAKRHNHSFPIKFFNGSTIVRETIARDDYNALIRPHFESEAGLDPTVYALVVRFTQAKLPYWVTLHAIRPVLEEFYNSILNGKAYQLPTLQRNE